MSLSQLSASMPQLRTATAAAAALVGTAVARRGVGLGSARRLLTVLPQQVPSSLSPLARSTGTTLVRQFRSSCAVLNEQQQQGDGINVDELLLDDPSRFVYGVTKERLKRDQELLTYFRENYPQAWKDLVEGRGRDEDDESLELQDLVEEEAKDQKKKKKKETVSYAQNIRPLHTFLRSPVTEEGSRASRRLRVKGYIPGTIHGADPFRKVDSRNEPIFVQTPWNVLQRELDRYHRNFESRVYDLTVYESPEALEGGATGQVHRVIPHNVNRHPVHATVYCVNYCRFHAARPIMIPYKPINQEESLAMKREGYIVPIQRKIECLIEDGVDIPEFLELECTGLTMRQAIRLDRILFPPGVRVTNRVKRRGDDYIIGVIFGKSRDALLEEEQEKAKAAEAAK